MPQTVLVLVPHPDDAGFYAGGALARWAAEGAKVNIVVAADGRLGSFMEDSDSLASLRTAEMRRAAVVLGAEPPVLLGHRDTELDRLPPGALRGQFVAAIRAVRPDAVVTLDPYALYEPHPDHRAVAWAAYEALACSHLPLVFADQIGEGLEPHYVSEKYFCGETLPGANRVLDTSAWIDRKIAALEEHRSQVVFLVEARLRQAAIAGLDLTASVGLLGHSPAALLAREIRDRDAATGRKAGYAFGEAFRYSRFDPFVEQLLQRSVDREA